MSVLLLLDRKTSVLDCCRYDQLLEQIWSQKVAKENMHVPLEVRTAFPVLNLKLRGIDLDRLDKSDSHIFLKCKYTKQRGEKPTWSLSVTSYLAVLVLCKFGVAVRM